MHLRSVAMEIAVPGLRERQEKKNKELPRQQMKTPTTTKKDPGLQLLLSGVLGSSSRIRRRKDGLTVQPDEAEAEVEAPFDSDDSEEIYEPGGSGKSIQPAGDGYNLRKRDGKPKFDISVLCSYEEHESSDDTSEDYEKSVVKVLQDVKPPAKWGAKKRRSGRGSPSETRRVSGTPKSTQETQNVDLRDRGKGQGFKRWISSGKRKPNDRRPSPGWPQVNNEILIAGKHLGRPLHEGNAVAGFGTVGSGSPPSSVGRIGSSCERNQPVRGCNMVTQIESIPRELGGLHEVPVTPRATPMTPSILKRKAGRLQDGFPEAHGLDPLSNRRPRSDGIDRAPPQQYYQFSSERGEAAEHSRGAVAGGYDQTPPRSPVVGWPNFDAHFDSFGEKFIYGEYAKGNPQLHALDGMISGNFYRSTALVSESQLHLGRECIPTLNLETCMKSPETDFREGEGVFLVPTGAAFRVASELGTNSSLGTGQSEQEHHPPPRYSAFQSTANNVDTPVQISYPSKSRRSLFSCDGVLPSATPIKVTQPLPNTADVVHANPSRHNRQASLSTPIAPALNDACMGIVDAEEDSEAEDGNLEDEDYEQDGDELFDLNEPPVQQQQRKNTKARKKHRPKVYREGRPSRPRKPKNPEEEMAKKKAREAKKVGEKPRGGKRKATTDLESSQGDPFGKQGSQSTPAGSSCVSGLAGCGQCGVIQRVSDAERGTPSQEGAQTSFPNYVSVRGPDSSPLFTSSSPSPNLSKNRVDEENRLIVTDNSVSRRRSRREWFKRARSIRSRTVVEQGLGLGENSQESLVLESQEPSMGEALVDPCASAAEFAGGAGMLRVWNPPNSEEVVLGKSSLIPTEMGLNARAPRKIRVAIRATRASPPILVTTKPRSVRSPSISRLVKMQKEKEKEKQTELSRWDQVVNGVAHIELSDDNLQLVPHVNQQTAMVRYEGPFTPLRRKKSRPKVKLDEEDKRLWRLVMAHGTSFVDDKSEQEAPRQWDADRAVMRARAESFINLMHLVQGDRRFSEWKGSVVDSVVGAFLTQNVSDHLSSSAFMCLAARFPVARKKKAAAETSQEPTVTEVQIDESFAVIQKGSELSEAVQKGSVAAFHVEEAVEISETFHVEEAVEISEKSSGTGGVSDIRCNGQALDHTGTELHNCAEEKLTDVKEQNSSCSSKDSQSPCDSCAGNAAFHAGESLEVRKSEQQICALVKDFTALQSRPEDVPMAWSGQSHVNSICSAPLVDLSEKEGPHMRIVSEAGSFFVDLNLGHSEDDLATHMEEMRKSILNGGNLCSNNLRTHETRWSSVADEKICSSTVPGVEGTCGSAEEVPASSGSPVSSSDNVDAHKLSQASLLPGSAIICADCEEIGANTAGVIFPSDSFDSNNSYHKQLVVSAAAADTDNLFQSGLSHLEGSPNLHALKTFIRTSPKKKGPKSPDVKGRTNSELVASTGDDQEKEARGRGRGKRPILGLSGLDRARLEESNITSKTEVDYEAVRLKYTDPEEMGENPQESAHAGCKSFGSTNVENGVDWDAVRAAEVKDIADVIKERGMNNVLAGRIKAFLERVHTEHGSVDLEWLRTVSVEEAKSFLLSVRGLGLKSVECIRLLTLHHLAFPVDTNVGRICVRLGWVPIEPLPDQLHLHLLELYPIQETIQKYLWPRLCTLDQRTLYELHYQMITFGKVFCTKSKPNCVACPMRDDCHHFASALASSRALPAPPPEDSHSASSEPLALPATTAAAAAAIFLKKVKLGLPPSDPNSASGEADGGLSNLNSFLASNKPCEPIVEEPSTPEYTTNDVDIEDMEKLFVRDEEPETFLGESSSSQGSDKSSGVYDEIVLPPAEASVNPASKAIVCLPPGRESIPVRKLINVGRLRTVHYVYELPDNHPLVKDRDPREVDDPCVYLLAIWSPGESPQTAPVLGDVDTNRTCDGFNGNDEETVKGTVLVPCRTAMRGIFPLNGTYFQVNEVFADHASSLQPIQVARSSLWNLRRRCVYFGTSVTTIFKNLTRDEIRACFWEGYICVRGFDSVTRCPRPLACRLHFPASKMDKKTKKADPVE